MGRMHAATLDRGRDRQRGLDALDADVTTALIYVFGWEQWLRVERACRALGLPAARSAREDVRPLLARIADPGQYLALTHLDLNPTNVVVTDTGVRLVDFEGCRFGHLGVDVCLLHYSFPHHSNPWGVLPQEVIQAADGGYRAALTSGGAAHVLGGYDAMLADGAAVAMLVRLLRLPLIAEADQLPADSWRRRGQIVQQVAAFGRLTARSDTLPDLTTWLRDLAAAVILRWPDALTPEPPMFPAFAHVGMA